MRSLVLVVVLLAGCNRVLPLGPGPAADDTGRTDATADGAAADAPGDGAAADSARDTATADDGSFDAAPLPDQGGAPAGWVIITAGTGTVGSPATETCRDSSNETEHQVTLTHDFELQRHEVTQGDFSALMGYNPSTVKSCGSACPVETVNWHEAAAYCNALSVKSGLVSCYGCSGSGATITCQVGTFSGAKIYSCPGYRLPTEAEWEYACRAGTKTAYYNGANDPAACGCAPTDVKADQIAWYCANAGGTSHPVGKKLPNAWGLHDMAGNVFEWVNDWYQANLGTATATDPWGAPSGTLSISHGGSWKTDAQYLRAAFRHDHGPDHRADNVGFRCARTRP